MTKWRTMVFVYGSLKRGFRNFHVMKRFKDAKYVAEATLDGADMYSLSAFPAIVMNPEGGKIKGEVWSIPEENLACLDLFEGHPDFYRRVEAVVSLAGGGTEEVWVYEYAHPETIQDRPRVTNGEWKEEGI